MKLTKLALKQIIKEEITNNLGEAGDPVGQVMDMIEGHIEMVTDMAKDNGVEKEHLLAAITKLVDIDYGQNTTELDPHAMLETIQEELDLLKRLESATADVFKHGKSPVDVANEYTQDMNDEDKKLFLHWFDKNLDLWHRRGGETEESPEIPGI